MAREQEEKNTVPNDDGVMVVAGAYTIVMGALFGIGGCMWLKEIFNKKYGGFRGRT